MRELVATRAGAEAGDDARERALRAAGVTVHKFALIRIEAPADSGPARRCLQRLHDYALALPVSPHAVRAAVALLDRPWPQACAIGVVGPGSAAAVRAALAARGDALPALIEAPAQHADSEGLWPRLQALRPQGWDGARVLVLRGGPGREWLSDQLRAAGAQVDQIDVYRRAEPAADAATLQRLHVLLRRDAAWLFSAGEAARHLAALLRAGESSPDALRDRAALATHARIAEAARQCGFGRVTTCAPGVDDIVAALRAL